MSVQLVSAARFVVTCDRCHTATPPHAQRPPGWSTIDAHIKVAGAAGSDWAHMELCPTCVRIVCRLLEGSR